MIQERRGTITYFFASRTYCILQGETFNLLATMLAHEMEDTIGLRQCLIRTARAFKRDSILFCMLGRNMDGECLGVEKLLLTCRTCMREMPFVLLHMVVHSILVLFDLRTDSTDKLTRSILLIHVRHLYTWTGVAGLQFLQPQRSSSASRNGYYDRHSSRHL
jgi:hypothetical protein